MKCTLENIDERIKYCNLGLCRSKFIPMLIDLGYSLSNQDGLSIALEKLLNYMRDDMNVSRAMINLYHRESGHIFIHKSLGLTDEEKHRGVYCLGEGITGKVVERGKTIIIPCVEDEPSFLNRTKCLSTDSEKKISFICVPILYGSKVMGAISAETGCKNYKLLQRHADILIIASHILAQALELYLRENVDTPFWQQRTQKLISGLKEQFKPANLIGTSKLMLEVYRLLNKVSQTNTTVLLLGESGVGKEMIANAIHFNGTNPEGPFIKFNCAALPESIVESELFGHEKGSFTGATYLRKGFFEEADGGTLFLDEVGELSLGVQAKLLRVLQEKKFERVGGSKPITVNIRILAATNADLVRMVSEGTFRADLYYRLNVFPITIPPLRAREDDILTLAEHFAKKFSKETKKSITNIANSAINLLLNYSWPGNVRELENAIHRAVILTEDDTIHSYDLPVTLQTQELSLTENHNDLEARLSAFEYQILFENLTRYHGHIIKTAKALGITRRALGIRMKKYKLNYKVFRNNSQDIVYPRELPGETPPTNQVPLPSKKKQ